MKRQKSGKHLEFIRSLPCLVCLDHTSVEAAHVRFSDWRVGKRQTGMGEKPDDTWTVPLCGVHHREQHGGNERAFWTNEGIDPIIVALALSRSEDHEAASRLIREWANGGRPQ